MKAGFTMLLPHNGLTKSHLSYKIRGVQRGFAPLAGYVVVPQYKLRLSENLKKGVILRNL